METDAINYELYRVSFFRENQASHDIGIYLNDMNQTTQFRNNIDQALRDTGIS